MLKKNNILYFDNNSTTPIDYRVLKSMLPYFHTHYANPNSSHHFGKSLNEAVKVARNIIAEFINSDSSEVIFTSGSTESINIALKGIALGNLNKGKHIVTVSTEHKAVLDNCKYLESIGYEVTYLSVREDGLINLNDLKTSIRQDTILVSVMFVNNETGIIQPIKQISNIVHECGAIFMTDATQAVSKININVDEMGIDLMCFSAHKMYGPKGIGVLYLKNNIQNLKFISTTLGGGHEKNIRSGTLNVPGIIGMGEACKLLKKEMQEDVIRMQSLRDKLELELKGIYEIKINGNTDSRVCNVTNILFPNVYADVLISKMKNVAVSNGSACNSLVHQPSHVLSAMGLSDNDAFSSIRFSLGKFTTKEEITELIKILKKNIS